MKRAFSAMQKLGKSLMLPIAVLPVAGLLLRFGQADLLDLPYVAAAGNAVFANLGLLFAIGVAVGLARESNGAAGLAAAVAYLVTTEGAKLLIDVPAAELAGAAEGEAAHLARAYREAAIAKLSVPAGLLSGITAGLLYNRYADIRLPDYLAFFAGRRFVPIVSGFAALALSAVFGYGWPLLEAAMNTLSEFVVEAGEFGLFLYGALNRALIITGLHHILNNLAWFLLGDFDGVTGDLRRFFAGDPSAGAFMSGFFPVMMFGLPAACLAMYHSARRERRKAVAGLLSSMALTSFLTGITEPIEFTFMFLAPLLYALHAVLTGISMALMNGLEVRLGFGFSAGLFDYLLNFSRAQNPLLLLPIGALYFAVYYFAFRYAIVRFDLPTPGRDAEAAPLAPGQPAAADEAAAFVAASGGADNLLDIDACATRLRLRVRDQARLDEAALKSLGATAVMRPSADTVQIIVGLRADEIASAMRKASPPGGGRAAASRRGAAPLASAPAPCDTDALIRALGGADNVGEIETLGTRLSIGVDDAARIDEQALLAAGFRGVARIHARRVQVLMSEPGDGSVSSQRRLR